MKVEGLYFGDEMKFNEIKLRGICLSIGCDFEFLIAEVICMCFIENPKHRKPFKIIMLENVTLGKKISIAKRVLNDYSEYYYKQSHKMFNNILKFTALRNLLCHADIHFDYKSGDTSILTFEYIKDGDIVFETKKIDDLFDELSSYKKDFDNLVRLAATLVKERGISDYIK